MSIKSLLFILLLGSTHTISAQIADPPNVLFILVDDLGYHDLGVTGSDFYETPHIDKLANSSFQFVRGYSASPVCSPARASIMTGVTPAAHHVTDWIGALQGEEWRKAGRYTKLLPPNYLHELDSSYLTLSESMKTAGYTTFFAGKWHLGGEGSLPEDHGFDTNIGGYSVGGPSGGYFAPYDNPKMAQGPDGENLSTRLARETAKFIEGKHEKPFFAMLSFYAVHAPIQTTETKWAKYRAKAETNGLKDHGYEMERRLPIRIVQDNPVYAGLVEQMDEAVGIVLASLKKAGVADNTIVIFTSDHGGVASGDNYSTSNLPLRGGKGYQWEGGLRVPYFIKIPSQQKLKVVDVPASGIDFYPTILDLIGQKNLIPEVEGVSLVPAMLSEEDLDRTLYWHYPHYGNQGGDPSSIIQEDGWKLIYYWESESVELYNLINDPAEQQDVADTNPELTNKLQDKLLKYLVTAEANKPAYDPEYNAKKEAEVLTKAKEVKKPSLEEERKAMLKPDWQPNADWWGSKVTKD